MINNKDLSIKYFKNGVKISLNKNFTTKKLYEKIENEMGSEAKVKLNTIPFKKIITKGKIYFLNYNDTFYSIYDNENSIYIYENKKTENHIHENIINIKNKYLFNEGDAFVINISTDLNNKNNIIKVYVTDNENDNSLDKKTAYLKIMKILKNINNIYDKIDLAQIYYRFNIKQPDLYNPIISDGVVTLSVANSNDTKIIDEKLVQCFSILNENRENVGHIAFDYRNNKYGSSEYGNVVYGINSKYQNKGYATRALKLLKELVKQNQYSGDKDLYFWIDSSNESSKKVVLNNGGEMIQEGYFGNTDYERRPYIYKIKI